MAKFYRLDENKNAVPCDVIEWHNCRQEMEDKDKKHVARDSINDKYISTVWIGLNHQHEDKLPPLIFETMIFSEESGIDEYCDRYSTWDETLAGHQRAIEWVKNGCKDD